MNYHFKKKLKNNLKNIKDMETRIDFNKKLSVKEAGKLIYELDNFFYEYMMLDGETERFIFKYEDDIADLLKLLDVYKEKTGVDYKELYKIKYLYTHFVEENNQYFIELMIDLFYYAYHKVASDVVYKLFEIEEE
jgi:hypothetical protein